MTLRIGWFATGRGPGSRALLRTVADEITNGLPVEIAYVLCNREHGEDENSDEFLRLVESLKLPLFTLSSTAFRRRVSGAIVRKGDPLPRWRLDFDDEVLRLVAPHDVDLGLLAGYMLIFGARACERIPLLNLHPAAPGGPVGIWQDVIWQLVDAGATRSGITIFRAVPEVDTGPPISFCTYSLRGGEIDALWPHKVTTSLDQLRASDGEELPLFKEIRRRGATREPILIVETLRALAEGRVRPDGSGAPLDLSQQVDTAIERHPSP